MKHMNDGYGFVRQEKKLSVRARSQRESCIGLSTWERRTGDNMQRAGQGIDGKCSHRAIMVVAGIKKRRITYCGFSDGTGVYIPATSVSTCEKRRPENQAQASIRIHMKG